MNGGVTLWTDVNLLRTEVEIMWMEIERLWIGRWISANEGETLVNGGEDILNGGGKCDKWRGGNYE